MGVRAGRAGAAAAAVLALLSTVQGCARKADAGKAFSAGINAELSRLDGVMHSIESTKLSEGTQQGAKDARGSLDRVRKAQSSEVRLYRLRDAEVLVGTLKFTLDHPEASKDLARFQDLWNAEKLRFNSAGTPHGTRLMRALSQAAGNRAQKLYVASLPYGKAAGAESGFYYLAEGEANLRYRDFIDALPVPPSVEGDAPAPQQVKAALEMLQGLTLQSFESNPTGPQAIPASAHLKEARELIDRGFNDGATLTLLESRLDLGRAGAAAEAAAKPSPTRNDSIRHFWLTIAAEGSPAAPLIRRDVVPFYDSMFSPVQMAARKQGPVTVTLVRWPYT